MEQEKSPYKSLWLQLRSLFDLEVENAKLLIVEKVSLIISSITFYAIMFLIVTCMMVFTSIGLSHLLLEVLEPGTTYLIVAAFYALLLIILISMRRRMIIDPITRYISTIILNPPTASEHNNQEADQL